MTERSGGSDISATETRAYPDTNDTWTIKGFKWFSSATDSDITLLLAKTPSSDKVSLFWVRVKNDDGTLNGIRIIRLKDKFGTKSIPTAELELIGMHGAVMIGKEGEGIKVISEVLNITRVHCALGCLTNMRRGFDIVIVFLFHITLILGLRTETESFRTTSKSESTPSEDIGRISSSTPLYDPSQLPRHKPPRKNRSPYSLYKYRRRPSPSPSIHTYP
jgi:hypothetical protein